MSSCAGRGCGGVGDEAAVDGVGDAAFEAAQCFSAAFSFVLFAVGNHAADASLQGADLSIELGQAIEALSQQF